MRIDDGRRDEPMMSSLRARANRLLNLLLSPAGSRRIAAGYYLLMIMLGSIPGKAEAMSEAVHDKLLHFAAYALLTLFVYGAINANTRVRAALTLAVIGFLGALDEGLQSLLPWRNASWADWQVDMLAALTTVCLLAFLHALRPAPKT